MKKRVNRRPSPAGELIARYGSRWVAAALVADVAVAALLWPLHDSPALYGLFLLPVLAVAATQSSERAAVAAASALVATLVCVVAVGAGTGGAAAARLGVVLAGSLFAVVGAELRERSDRARIQMGLLGDISRLAESPSPLERSRERLPGLLVPLFADLVRILLPDQASELEDGAIFKLGNHPQTPAAVAVAGEELTSLGMRSAIVVPMLARGSVLGGLLLARDGGRRPFGATELAFTQTLASRAGLAVDNARLLAEAEESRRRMEAVIGSLAEAVTIRDSAGQLVYANRAALDQMGLESTDELLRRGTRSIMDEYVTTDENGDQISVEALPSVRLLAGEPVEPLLMRVVHRTSGRERWRLLKATPLLDRDGALEAAVTVIEDVTETKRTELRNRFLSRVSQTLSQSLDLEVTLERVAQLAVPEIADWCSVDLLDREGARLRLAVAHREPAKLELARRLRTYEPEEPDPETGIGLVLRTGEPVLYADIPAELLEASARDAEHLGLLRELQLRSVLIVPLRAAGRTVGAMTLVSAESGRRFDEEDVRFAQEVAARAAVAVENSRQATQRGEVARTLQRSLLPDRLPQVEGWELAAVYRPSGAAEEVEVGGDFYDVLDRASGQFVLLGDVTGKGIEAASLTSLLRHGARFASRERDDPADILASINEVLLEQSELSLCSMLCLRLGSGEVLGASGGHPSPLVLRDDGRLREIGLPGPLLGAWPGTPWRSRTFPVAVDETIVIYTDGVVEAEGEQERFGSERLRELLRDRAGASPAELLTAIEQGVARFRTTIATDDIAALALRPR